MTRQTNRLSALAVGRLTDKGMHADGAGLYLQITATGSKSWIFRYMLNGKAREMGLGPLSLVTLSEARAKAKAGRQQCLDGIDPITARTSGRRQTLLEAASATTFTECASSYIDAHKVGWRNPKHIQQWENTIETYARPVIGALSVRDVDLPLVLKVLEPIWRTKPETASRLRGRIESILDWATVRGYRQGENPARWKGHLETLLPQRAKVQKVEHHAALPYCEAPAFMSLLRKQSEVSARAFEFLILTAARTGEVIGATWNEIDMEGRLWTVPANRIKAGKEHRVPLSDRALVIIREMRKMNEAGYVFPGGRLGKPFSNMAFLALLKRIKRPDITAHGFRSTFRDWAAEQTDFPREAAEMALAHTVGDKVEAAYRRGDLFEKRKELMQNWATFCQSLKSLAQ